MYNRGVHAFADRIELELRRLGRWSANPVAPERLVDVTGHDAQRVEP